MRGQMQTPQPTQHWLGRAQWGCAATCRGMGALQQGTRTAPGVPGDHPFFHFQSLAQEPHCSSSSQEMGLEKTSLSNQRS